MRSYLTLFILVHLLISASLFAQSQTDAKPESFQQKLSYAYGAEVAQSLKQREVPIDINSFLQAFVAHSQNKPLQMTHEQIGATFQEYEKRLAEKNASPEDRKRIEEGYKFMATQAAKKNVIETPSGLLYQIIKQGSGAKPKLTDRVSVTYKGSLIDGSVFEDSGAKQATFYVSRVIRGWQEGLQLMPVGSEYRFFVPHFLAYRNAPKPQDPYSTLVFDVKLIAVEAN